MCYTIPGKLIDIKDNIGAVDYSGEKKKVRIDYIRAEIGDYVYAQGGILIDRIPRKEALKVLETWGEVFFELKKMDEKMGRITSRKVSKNIFRILQKVKHNKKPAKPGDIKNFCLPNCILTFKEYVLDYGDDRLTAEVERLIEKELDKISDDAVRRKSQERLKELESGKRDLYF